MIAVESVGCPPTHTHTRGTPPRHLWPKSARHDISNIRRRAKVIRRLIKHEAIALVDAQEEPSPRDPSLPLRSNVNTSLPLLKVLSPPSRDLNILGLFARTDLDHQSPFSQHATHACFKRLSRAIRLLIRHARNLRRQKYGKALLRMFVKNLGVALNFILRTSAGTSDTPTLPTDLSILRNVGYGLLLTTPSEVIKRLTQMETIAPPPSGSTISLARPRPTDPHFLGPNVDQTNHPGHLPRGPPPHAEP